MTPGCAERGELLAPYVDGELDAAAAEAFSHHLAACEACRAGLHDALQLVAVEARAASPPASVRVPDVSFEEQPASRRDPVVRAPDGSATPPD
ncbi:MAG TPA: zf-HC2 domain-containing protein, partial [Kofleriaceae bacterium]